MTFEGCAMARSASSVSEPVLALRLARYAERVVVADQERQRVEETAHERPDVGLLQQLPLLFALVLVAEATRRLAV